MHLKNTYHRKDGCIKGENMKVNILGTEYTIMLDVPEEDMPKDSDGCMDHSTKIIKIMKMEQQENSVGDLENYKRKVLRHEIIHAFFYESGLWNCSGCSDAWGIDETITDWIAIQFPKILKAFQECDCL